MERIRHIRRATVMFMVAAALGMAACNDDNDNGTNPTGSAQNDTTLSDGGIMHVAMTLNQGEVITNQPGVSKGTTDSVRAFAQMMVTEHGSTAQLAQTTAGNAGLALQPNAISASLNSVAQGVAAKLSSLNGASFDSTFMEAQVTMHHQALDMLDYALIPKAQNQQVRTFLTNMRATVAQHLTRATALMNRM
jgi:putative membrane protein